MKDTLQTLCELTTELCNRDLSHIKNSTEKQEWITTLEGEISRLRDELKSLKKELRNLKGDKENADE